MTKQSWMFVCLLSVVTLGASWYLSHKSQQAELERTQSELMAKQAQLQQVLHQTSNLEEQLQRNRDQIQGLEKEKQTVTDAQKKLEREMRGALESRDITISELKGRLTVNILDRILFASGEAELKPDGEEVLRKIASVLAQVPNRQVHVIGHTDNVPIRASAWSRFQSNWELSTGRATAAVRFLVEKAGVDPQRLGALGYGEFHPAADNATAEGRAKNRRIAIVVLPEELSETFVPALMLSPAPPPGSSNAPAAALPPVPVALPPTLP